MKRIITERDIWSDSEPMYPDLSVTATASKPVIDTVTISMSGEYAQRLIAALVRARDGNFEPNADVSILQRLLEVALKRA